MRLHRFFIILTVIGIVACKKNKQDNNCPDQFSLGQAFDLCYDQKASLDTNPEEGFHFQTFIEDSRCPEDVTCIRAGSVQTIIAYVKNGSVISSDSLELGDLKGSFNTQDTINLNGYQIILTGISPYPVHADGPIDLNDYKMRLVISK